ncbi:MAG: DUF2795 domain-containing protein [Candidatus Blackburnbacteria bacterium]|nr:DUF2795 domain-containing protein [Candidatus Blackburnbacteria bacterium]
MNDELTNTNPMPTYAEVEAFLEGITYPATKDQLIEYATQQRADDNILAILERLPEETYESSSEVEDALSEQELIGPLETDEEEIE